MKHLTKLCIFETVSPLPDAVIALVSFFLENQTKIALQLILLFQANYPDTLKATTTTKYSVAVPLLSESGLAPEDVPRLLSVPKSGTWRSLCSCLRHESESQIFLLV